MGINKYNDKGLLEVSKAYPHVPLKLIKKILKHPAKAIFQLMAEKSSKRIYYEYLGYFYKNNYERYKNYKRGNNRGK